MVAHFPKDRVAAGFLMEKELKALGKVTKTPKSLGVIFGGAKVSDKIELIKNFLGKADAILIGGAMSYTFLKAQGSRSARASAKRTSWRWPWIC